MPEKYRAWVRDCLDRVREPYGDLELVNYEPEKLPTPTSERKRIERVLQSPSVRISLLGEPRHVFTGSHRGPPPQNPLQYLQQQWGKSALERMCLMLDIPPASTVEANAEMLRAAFQPLAPASSGWPPNARVGRADEVQQQLAEAERSRWLHEERRGAARRAVSRSNPTLTPWLLKEKADGEVADDELAIVLVTIAQACKETANLVQLAGLDGAPSGLGNACRDAFSNYLQANGRLVEFDLNDGQPATILETFSGKYIVCLRPLSGYPTIDAGTNSGSIWGVYETSPTQPLEPPGDIIEAMRDLSLNRGTERMRKRVLNIQEPLERKIKCAGYCLYGSPTTIMLSTGQGVNRFILDISVGEFKLAPMLGGMGLPLQADLYRIYEGNSDLFEGKLRRFMEHLRFRGYCSQRTGSLVGDVHLSLVRGGICGFPGEDPNNNNGKPFLLYESAPLSFLADKAGLQASDGQSLILGKMPLDAGLRTPLFIGSYQEISDLKEFLEQ